MAFDRLLSPLRFGALELPNRVLMAPLTRARCRDQIPGAMQREYYAQRAEAQRGKQSIESHEVS